MARAMENVADSGLLIRNPALTFTNGKYSYRIERRGSQSFYSVSDGSDSVVLPVRYAIGAGVLGQTYVLEHDGELYEGRVSYFADTGGLDITIGHDPSPPPTLLEAAGRLLGIEEKLRCFSCHSTGAVRQRELLLDQMTPGVQCEHCHEQAFPHLEAKLSSDSDAVPMKHLSTLSAGEILNFCGQCHRTSDEIVLSGMHGIATIRFQPYRLEFSKCFSDDDSRISCIACHDPHQPLDIVADHYDSRCQACHKSANVKPGVCSFAKKGCISCHMPKFELPGAHHKFVDHRIRIVKQGEKFPG
jgi:Cytochrome c554 and c-prime